MLIESLGPLPSLFNEKRPQYYPGTRVYRKDMHNPFDILPSPWIAAKLIVEEHAKQEFPITLLWEHVRIKLEGNICF